MKSRTDKEFIFVFQNLHGHLITRGIKPNYMLFNIKAFPAFQNLLKEKIIDYQLSPPGMHQCNEEERSFGTFKDHFIEGICSTDTNFLI